MRVAAVVFLGWCAACGGTSGKPTAVAPDASGSPGEVSSPVGDADPADALVGGSRAMPEAGLQVEGDAVAADGPAVLGARPERLVFPDTATGQPSSPQTVTVTNYGDTTSGKLVAAINGEQSAEFSAQANGCSAALAGGAWCAFSVTFTPRAVGLRRAEVVVTGSAGATARVSIEGSGTSGHADAAPQDSAPSPSASFTPGQIFIPGSSEGRLRFVLVNTGSAGLSVELALSEDPFPPSNDEPTGFKLMFTEADPMQCRQQQTLAPKASCNADVYYTPNPYNRGRTLRLSLLGGSSAITSATIVMSPH